MDELRSLEGVGHLLSQKLNQNDSKIKTKPSHKRSISVPTKLSGDSSISISISTFYPPQLAATFTNSIIKGFDQAMPAHKPNLMKSQSGFARKNISTDHNNNNNSNDKPSIQVKGNNSSVHFSANTIVQNVISPTQSMSPPLSPLGFQKLTLENQVGHNSGSNGPNSYSNRGSLYGHFQALPQSPSFRMGSFRMGNSLHLDLGDIGLLTEDDDGQIHSTRSSHTNIIFPPPVSDSPVNGSYPAQMSTILSPEVMDFPSSPKTSNGGGPTVPPLRKIYSNNELFTLYSGDDYNSSTEDILKNNTQANRSIPQDCVPILDEKKSNTVSISTDNIDMDMKLEDFMEYQSEQKDSFNNIGNGASGIVKKAFHFRSCQMVAIKQCRSKTPQEVNAFIKEAKLYEKFNDNVNIANILGFGKDDNGNTVMAMEYMDLGSCDSLKIHERKQEWNDKELIVKYIIYNTLKGLIAIHDKLYVHNDIKPANILCNKYGEIKLSDFGTVLQLKNKKHLLKKNNGTQIYQSPEKMIGKPLRYNSKTDIWSIGVTTFELLFGDNYGQKEDELAYINTTPDISNKKLYKISKECSEFIMLCFEKDYTKRKSAKKLIKHKWFKDLDEINININIENIWPWYIPIPGKCDMVENMINNPKGSTGRERGNAFKNGSKGKGVQWACDVKDNNIQKEFYNEDLLFMISALIIYYSAQFFDLNNENNQESRFLHRRRSQFTQDKDSGKMYSDDERITNMAKYACCPKNIVLEKIRSVVNNIKSQINQL